jgi:hypothetical protein
MDLTKFRQWAGKAMAHYETRFAYTGEVNPYTAFAENLEPVTEDKLQNPEYRRKNRMMLASGITDNNNLEIYEGDILEVYTARTSTSSRSVRGYVEHFPDKGFLVCYLPTASDVPVAGLDCEVVGNFFDSPEWIDSFGADKALVERWT